jgi:hypothetical protein
LGFGDYQSRDVGHRTGGAGRQGSDAGRTGHGEVWDRWGLMMVEKRVWRWWWGVARLKAVLVLEVRRAGRRVGTKRLFLPLVRQDGR